MSSPPPPPPPPIIPQKRPSLSSNASASGNPNKRRTALHPLRQTSFPALDAAPYATGTPSVYSDAGSVTGSMISGVSGSITTAKKRGRPKKNAPTQAGSLAPGSESGARPRGGATSESASGRPESRSGRSAGGSLMDVGEADEDDDDDGLGDAEAEGDLEIQTERDDEEKGLKMQLIENTMAPALTLRRDAYKSAKLNDRNFKKIVNQTCSQSVAQKPIKALGFAVKWFIGEVVELACDVQTEMAERWDEAREMKLRKEEDAKVQAEKENQEKDQSGNANGKATQQRSKQDDQETPTTIDPSTPDPFPRSQTAIQSQSQSQPQSQYKIPAKRSKPVAPPGTTLAGHENPHRGGLLPEHLREALRRYRESEGNGVGFGGLSIGGLGVKGGKSWTVDGVGFGASGGAAGLGGRIFR